MGARERAGTSALQVSEASSWPPSGEGFEEQILPVQCDSRPTSWPLAPTRKSRSAPRSACITWST